MRLRVVAIAVVLSVLVGCELPVGDTIVYPSTAPELANASVDADGVWESAPWTGAAWLPYPGVTTVQIEHALGRTPRSVLVYLSFEETGEEAAIAAGDLARIDDVDDSTVTLRNETSASFFLRVVAY